MLTSSLQSFGINKVIDGKSLKHTEEYLVKDLDRTSTTSFDEPVHSMYMNKGKSIPLFHCYHQHLRVFMFIYCDHLSTYTEIS